jgi:hypothetical protein
MRTTRAASDAADSSGNIEVSTAAASQSLCVGLGNKGLEHGADEAVGAAVP